LGEWGKGKGSAGAGAGEKKGSVYSQKTETKKIYYSKKKKG